MESITCHEDGCENVIDPKTMEYGRDFYVLIDLTDEFPQFADNLQALLDNGLVGVYCKNCGFIKLAEAAANGLEIVSKRKV